jgi:predicted alpha/beta superfamily hydrolase
VTAAALLGVVAGFLVCRRFAGEPAPAPGAGVRSGALQSAVLGERREYVVHLPDGYDANPAARFPVVYVLDGLAQSQHTAESASLLARLGVIPPVIVVGVPNLSRSTRDRDLTPPEEWSETAGFLTFLGKELIPQIEREYRASRPRMLAGWSRGGLFVLYSQMAEPSLFDGRFAHSPHLWGGDDPNVRRFTAAVPNAAAGFLYISLGDQEAAEMSVPLGTAVRALETSAPPALRWRFDRPARADHNSTPVLATPVALCLMFAPSTGQRCGPLSAPQQVVDLAR